MSHTTYDCLVIGAGYAGAVTARELAERGNQQVLVLEQRDHIGGNAYDRTDEAGILIHQYGPHIFHTSDRRVWEYLSRFTAWYPYHHRVVANVHGTLMPVPFNLTSLHLAFSPEQAARIEHKLLETYGAGARVSILALRETTDPDLAVLADYVYQNVFLHYTMKQWGQSPEEIDPATTARVPVLLSREDGYFGDPWQGMPREGYTALFRALLDHPNITVALHTPAADRMQLRDGAVLLDGVPFSGPVIYTGAADELFSCRFGRLPYRTLDFRFETHDVDFYQTRGTVNYTVDQPFTRITEFKHMTGQALPGRTTIMKEYSRAYTGASGETPYYAIINDADNALYGRYRELAAGYPNLHLLGRLAEYKYYNMDAIAARALTLSDALLGEEHSV
ncbi:MAG: UDP-galactopyranose mutase [Intestinimonas sp.]|jgi:UDP-galactopyranose mutase|nr:UDP-galactopyranose mutase [Intestinimonas sp.]